MAHDYCPYELVFGSTLNLPKHFNSKGRMEPIYAKKTKFRLDQGSKRVRLI